MRVTKTLVRWPCHSRTYSSILCGGRTTHAHILPFSKLLCGGRTTHAHILVRWPHIFFHFQTLVPLTHIFFHFQKLWCGGRNHSRTNFKFKSPVQWPYHSCTCPKSIKPTWAHMKTTECKTRTND